MARERGSRDPRPIACRGSVRVRKRPRAGARESVAGASSLGTASARVSGIEGASSLGTSSAVDGKRSARADAAVASSLGTASDRVSTRGGDVFTTKRARTLRPRAREELRAAERRRATATLPQRSERGRCGRELARNCERPSVDAHQHRYAPAPLRARRFRARSAPGVAARANCVSVCTVQRLRPRGCVSRRDAISLASPLAVRGRRAATVANVPTFG